MDDGFPRAVLFDLLTALLDSWTLWDAVSGSEATGRAWRAEYLRLTYGSAAYVPYEKLVRDAARAVGLPDHVPQALEERWPELKPWSDVPAALAMLRGRTKLAVVTNCSITGRPLRVMPVAVRWSWRAATTASLAGPTISTR